MLSMPQPRPSTGPPHQAGDRADLEAGGLLQHRAQVLQLRHLVRAEAKQRPAAQELQAPGVGGGGGWWS